MFDYAIDHKRGLVLTTIGGRVTVEELQSFTKNLISDPDFKHGLDALTDIEKDANLNFLPHKSDFKKIMETFARAWQEGVKWAIVFHDEESLALSELNFRGVTLDSVQMVFFLDRQEALDWLGR